MVALLVHLHGIAKGSRGPRDYRYLMYRSGIILLCRNKGVSYLMVGYYELFLIGKDLVFLFVSGHYDLDAFLEILLSNSFTAGLYGTERSLVYHICKLGSGSSRAGLCDIFKIDVAGHFDILCMYLEDVHTALHIRQLYRHSPVETARS